MKAIPFPQNLSLGIHFLLISALIPSCSADIQNISNINANSLPAFQGFKITNNVGLSQLGYSSASAGDFNKDGYADIIIGAMSTNGDKDAAYIIYGGASNYNLTLSDSISLDLGVRISTPQIGADFAFSVGYAGDINQDGYSDVMIGSSYENNKTGAVYVIFGGPSVQSFTVSDTMTNSQGFKLTGPTSGSNFGNSVCFAGDINKDGVADLAIGASHGPSNAGAVYIIYGNSQQANMNISDTMDPTIGFKITCTIANIKFGGSVSAAGDINKDGYADIVIGAARVNPGMAYIIFGASTDNLSSFSVGNTIPAGKGIIIFGSATETQFGAETGSAGDMNKDGYSDIALSCVTDTAIGAAYIIFGGPSLSNFTASTTIPISLGFRVSITSAWNYYFGNWLTSIGDINKDGYSDILVGAPSPTNNTGAAFVIFGGPTLSSFNISSTTSLNKSFTINSTVVGSAFGFSTSYAGDMNKDGNPYFLVTAYGENYNGGSVYIMRPTVFPCASNQYTPLNTYSCANCSTNCTLCTSWTNCEACIPPYVISSGFCTNPPTSQKNASSVQVQDNSTAPQTLDTTTDSNSTNIIANVIYYQNIITIILNAVFAIADFPASSRINFYGLSKMLEYVIYLKIDYPSNLEDVFEKLALRYAKSSNPSNFDLFFTSGDLLPNFRNLNSNFFLNMGWVFLLVVIILMLIGLLTITERKTKTYPEANKYVLKGIQALKWGFFIAVLASMFIQVSFCSSLELWQLKPNSPGRVISGLTCIISNLIVVLTLFFLTYMLCNIHFTINHKKHLVQDIESCWKDKWKDYYPLFKDLRHGSNYWTSYLPLISIRFYVFGFIFGGLTLSPRFQTSLLFVFSTFLFVYTALTKPIQDKYRLISCLVDEFIIIFVYLLVLSLAIMDSKDKNSSINSTGVGAFIIALYIIFYTKFLIVTLIETINKVINIYKSRKGTNQVSRTVQITINSQNLRLNVRDLTKSQNKNLEIHSNQLVSNDVKKQKLMKTLPDKALNENIHKIDQSSTDISFVKDDSSMSISPMIKHHNSHKHRKKHNFDKDDSSKSISPMMNHHNCHKHGEKHNFDKDDGSMAISPMINHDNSHIHNDKPNTETDKGNHKHKKRSSSSSVKRKNNIHQTENTSDENDLNDNAPSLKKDHSLSKQRRSTRRETNN